MLDRAARLERDHRPVDSRATGLPPVLMGGGGPSANRCAGRRLWAYAKNSECVGVGAPTLGTLSIAPNRPCVSPSMPSVK